MKARFNLIIIFLFFCLTLPGIAQHTWEWTVAEGGKSNESINAIDTDNSGNIYITGGFQDTTILFGETYISSGYYDVFIASVKLDGTLNWIKFGGGDWEDSGWDICTDNSFVYITGIFHNEFSIGDTSVTSIGAMDVFIAKFDVNGNFQWVESAGGVTDDKGKSLAVNDSGDVYITGDINFTSKFGDYTVEHTGFSDSFVAKYGSDGVCKWAKSFGGTLFDSGECIEMANNGDVVIAGNFGDQIEINSQTIISQEFVDIFIARFGADGTFKEIVSAGGVGNESVLALAIDSTSNIYISGWYMSNITIGSEKHYSNGIYDIFIAKYEPDNGFAWSKSFGGIASDEGSGLYLLPDNYLLFTGTFEQTIDFGIKSLNSYGFDDGFFAMIDTSGSFQWVYQVEGTGSLDVRDCIADYNGNFYIAGVFVDEISIGGNDFIPTGGYDFFIAKMVESASSVVKYSSVIKTNCYPNPFSISTTISYIITNYEHVTLKVYNSQGNLIQILVNEFKDPGKHHIDFKGTDLPGGIYFFTIETEGGISRKSIVKI